MTTTNLENFTMPETDHKYDLESKIAERVKEQLEKLKETIAKELKEVVWTACNDYVEFAEYEPLKNWKDRERGDLVGSKYLIHKDSYWGKQMREKLFEEHKEEILPMIKDEHIESLEKEVASLKESLEYHMKFNRRDY